MVPSPAVFYAMFNLKEEKKAWKQKKISLEEFEAIAGEMTASVRIEAIGPHWTGLIIRQIRYGYLQITS